MVRMEHPNQDEISAAMKLVKIIEVIKWNNKWASENVDSWASYHMISAVQ